MSTNSNPPIYLPQGYPLWVCWLPNPELLGSPRRSDRVIAWAFYGTGVLDPILAEAGVQLNTEKLYLRAYGETNVDASQLLDRMIDDLRDQIHADE